jgi:outer membrane protein OmpA-like peptidoglycan-associated protein
MKKILFLAMMIIPAMGFSQGLLNKLKNKVKAKAEQRVEKNVDKALDKGFDKVEDAAKPNAEGTTAKSATPAPQQTATTENTATNSGPALKSYSRFDFVPGDSIVYTENFEQDVIGELPRDWNTSGNGEIVTLNNFPVKWMKLYQNTDYLTSNTKEFGENYTVEFDVIMVLKFNGHFYPYFSVALCASNGEPTTGNDFMKGYKKNAAVETIIYPAESNYTKVRTTSYLDGKVYYKGDDKTFGYIEKRYGKPVHVAIQVQKERMRIWIDQEKLADFPRAVATGYIMNQLQFQVHPSSYKEDQYGMYIGNLKVAKGIPDTRHKLIEEGKFSTTGILFDVNSDVIKPESYGVIKGIAAVLKENGDVKVKVIGHTDSDGNDAANLTLSQKRAAAVIKVLSDEFGIEAARLQSDGKGETQPVADNKTTEGKAANRRVEFIKQ